MLVSPAPHLPLLLPLSSSCHQGLAETNHPHTYHSLFHALDTDRDSYLQRADLSAWFLDEIFINNPYFDLQVNGVSSIDELVNRYMQRWDRRNTGRISYEDWSEWMKGRKDKGQQRMAHCSLPAATSTAHCR